MCTAEAATKLATFSIKLQKNVKKLCSKNKKNYFKISEHFENKIRKTDIVISTLSVYAFQYGVIHLRLYILKVLHFIISSNRFLFLCFLFTFHFVES